MAGDVAASAAPGWAIVPNPPPAPTPAVETHPRLRSAHGAVAISAKCTFLLTGSNPQKESIVELVAKGTALRSGSAPGSPGGVLRDSMRDSEGNTLLVKAAGPLRTSSK